MIETRGTVPLGIGDEVVSIGDHIAFMWETPGEFASGVGFLAHGLEGDDYGVIFGHNDANDQVLSALAERGLDVDGLLTTGRITIMQGSEDAGAMLAAIGAGFRDSMAKGAQVIRLLGNLGWARTGWPNEREILAFEAKVTEAARLFPCIVVCMYDVSRLSGGIMVHGAYETHPHTIQRNILRENPYHVPSEEFLRILDSREDAGNPTP